MEQITTSTSTIKPKKIEKAPAFTISNVHTGVTWLKLLVYGKHGAGKTTLAGSAADVKSMSDVFMINAESGEMVLEDNPRVNNFKDIDIAHVSNFKQVAKMYEFLTSHCALRDSTSEESIEKMKTYESRLKGVDVSEIHAPRRYRTVIIDSLTELDALCMYGLLGLQGAFDLSWIADSGNMRTAEFSEYKKNNNMVNLLVRAFRDLPMNVIILCGQAYEQDELKRFHYAPNLTGKLKTQVQGYFDIVGYLAVGSATEDKEASRRLYVQPVGKWDAKNRKSAFKGSYFDDPIMKSILEQVGLPV